MKLRNAMIAALLATSLFGATRASGGPTWAQTYGTKSQYNDGTIEGDSRVGPGADQAVAIAKMPDGGVVAVGRIDLPELGSSSAAGGNADATLVRYAADGGILWQKMLRPTSGGASHVYQIATDANG